jgi:hypothetical protein
MQTQTRLKMKTEKQQKVHNCKRIDLSSLVPEYLLRKVLKGFFGYLQPCLFEKESWL